MFGINLSVQEVFRNQPIGGQHHHSGLLELVLDPEKLKETHLCGCHDSCAYIYDTT